MKLLELRSRLLSSGVPEDAFGLAGGLPNEAYCIERLSDGKWRTYYSERGRRSGEKFFDSEDEACEDFFRDILRGTFQLIS